ncbi:putative anonymous antigen-1 [Besnoitia besnoiti]|uniref:Putative anonymous antigen-1 n=1 Tax=Besnoitia besnoiti TaxID=94643 RepID=A0A2A9M6Y6_BESBE|nr:putative anonymous antigen-1 [Besnoitia besnoiti]PFH34228.1 putative anonymous antigen-1 [Besnoitia besnoiti]
MTCRRGIALSGAFRFFACSLCLGPCLFRLLTSRGLIFFLYPLTAACPFLLRPVKRNPDAGVATAVQSVIQHQTFKRMLLFGLRSLADFCGPSNQLYQENALDAMDRGVLAAMQTAVTTFSDDEDLMLCAARVIWAMSAAVKEEMDAAHISQLHTEGSPIVVAIVNSSPTDPQTIEDTMNFIDNLNRAGAPIDGASIAGGMLSIFSKAAIGMKTAKRVTAALAIAAESAEGSTALYNAGGTSVLLTYCLNQGDQSDAGVEMVEGAFDTVRFMAVNQCTDSSTLTQCIELMDKYRSKKSASAKGSAALAAMIGPEQLQKCLQTLKSAESGSPEYDDALVTLGSMSYISSFTDEIVKAGGVPLLVELINSGLPQLESNPEKIASMISGAAKMLARIASNPSNVDAIVQAGGVATLCTAVSYCTESMEALGSLCMALVPLSTRESLAHEIVQYQTFATVLPILYQNVESPEIASLAMELVAAGSQHAEIQEHMLQNQAAEICSLCCQYHTADVTYQQHAISALNRLVPRLTTLQGVSDYGGIQGVTISLTANVNNEQLALVGVQLLDNFSQVADAKSFMSDGTCVDAVLAAMLEHEGNDALISCGIDCLGRIATENDCARHLDVLDSAIQTVRGDPDGAYKVLAAISGLSRVPTLRQIFEEKQAADTIMKGIASWIECTRFEGQGRIVRAGLKCVKNMKISGDGDLTSSFVSMCDVACLPQVKRVVELEEPDSNILVVDTAAFRDLAATMRISSKENIEQCIEGVLRVMRKYPDSRRAQINCLETLNYLVQCDGGDGVGILARTGGLNAVVQYLNRAPMYLDAQIAGFTVLATCAKIDPSTAETMKKCNCLQALKVAMRTHAKSKELKRTIAPLLALLMPTDALEREIQELLAECEDACAKNNFAKLHENLSALNELLISAEGAKIAARSNIGPRMCKFQEYIVGHEADAFSVTDYDILGKDLYDATVSECAHAMEQVAATRVGRTHLIKAGNVSTLINLYESLKGPQSQYYEDAAVHCLDGLRLLLKGDKRSAELAFERNFVDTLCVGIDNFPQSAPVLAATCGCLAAMATTPERVQMLTAQPAFESLLQKLVFIIQNDPKKESKLVAMRALQDLLETTNDATMATKIAEAGAVTALFRIIDEYGDDEQLTTQAARVLALIGTFDDLRRFYDNDVRFPAQVVTEALAKQQNNEQAVINLLDVLNKLVISDDRAVLRELGLMEQVADAMRIHSESDEVTRLGGELFAKMGADEQIKSLMLQIIDAVESGAEDTAQRVDNLCARLAMFLAAPLEDPKDALQHTEKCLGSLVVVLGTYPGNERLEANVAWVTRRLCDRCFDDPNDPFGAWAVTASGMLSQYANMIAAESVNNNKRFLGSAYRTLAACCANAYCMPTMLEVAPSFLPQTYALLELHKNDAETVSRILEFLRYFAEDAAGCELIMQYMSGSSGDILALAMLLMQQHQHNDGVVTAGMELLGALAYNLAQAGYEPLPAFADGSILRDCEALVGSNASEARQLAHMHMIERLLLSKSYNETLIKEQTLKKLSQHLKAEDDKKRLTDEQRAGVYAAMARVLLAASDPSMTAEVEKCQGFELLLQAIEEFPENPAVIKEVNRALQGLAAADQNMMVRTVKEAVPKLCAEATSAIQTDPECADTFCDLMLQLVATEGNGRQLLQVYGLEETLQGITNLGDYYGDEFGQQLKDKVAMIRQAMEDDQPREKTCKDVYDLLNNRTVQGLSVAISEVAMLQEEAEFLFTQMAVYNKEQLDSQTAMGADHQYGNMAFELLAANPANVKLLQANDFSKISLALIKGQKDEEIILYAVKALVAFCRHPPAAQDTARIQGCPALITDACAKINKSKDLTNERKEEHLCARYFLVERTAVNRNLYNKTPIMTELIKTWDDYDKGAYTSTLLRHVFRAMRRVVSDAHVEELLKANVLQRLIAIVSDVNADIALLPDVLFLLGSLAVVPEIKTKIGELNGVSACTDLLKRSLPNPAAAAVVTNVCLAFANICIGHKKNTEIFSKLGGPDLNVRVLNERGHEYDICNAASVLLCNLLYKNEVMKKFLGTNGAPAALVKGLSNYDGSEEKSAIRCLESVFKAISNLSLYTPNIQPFLDAGIENAYSTWLSNLSETFPDAQLETGCRTLTNLVMENEESNMRKFGVCLLPCMAVAKQGRTDTKALLLLLDIEASLCRLPENAQIFADNGGIETTIRLIHQFDYDVALLTLGIHLLGIQSAIKESIQKLLDADVFSILVGCVEVDAEGNEVTDLVVGGLRCTRRIVRSEELAFEYCNAGGIATIANVICKSINQPMVMLEACRVLLGLLFYTTRSQSERQAAVQALNEECERRAKELYDQAVADYESGATTEPPPEEMEVPEPDADELANAAYGGWYQMGMDEVMIGAILQAVCACAATEAHAKQLRLQRVCLGLAAYFASEQMGADSLVGSGVDQVMTQNLTNFAGEATTSQLCCVIINSIAMTSGDMYEEIKSKELMGALKTSLGKLPTKKPEEKAIKEVCTKTLNAMGSSEDPFDAFSKTVTELDFALTEWNVDPYPNGVHDLPSGVKEALRKGGKLKVFMGDKAREEIRWRSSQDLNAFEWSVGTDQDFNNRVPIVRIRNVAKGLVHPALQNAAKKEPRKVTPKLTLCLFGPPNDDFPNGVELPMKAKTQKERDQFVELMVQWRDAATYNF